MITPTLCKKNMLLTVYMRQIRYAASSSSEMMTTKIPDLLWQEEGQSVTLDILGYGHQGSVIGQLFDLKEV